MPSSFEERLRRRVDSEEKPAPQAAEPPRTKGSSARHLGRHAAETFPRATRILFSDFLFRDRHRFAVSALVLGVLLGGPLIVSLMASLSSREVVSLPAPSQERIRQAEMERQRDAERQREAERQRREEAERRLEAERQELERQRKAQRQLEIASQQQQEREKERFRGIVEACISIVRERSDARRYRGSSHFDAYVTFSGESGQTYTAFGTPEEQFQFTKCMAKRDIELSTPTEQGKR